MSVVVPYFRMHEHVGETVDSILAQTVPAAEVILVIDGSFSHDDEVVDRLAERHGLRVVAQPNTGLSAARNLGVAVATRRHVLPLDPDNCLEPEFIERCLHALGRDESLAYATTWSRYIDEESRPVPGDDARLPAARQLVARWSTRTTSPATGPRCSGAALFDSGTATTWTSRATRTGSCTGSSTTPGTRGT